MTLLDKVVEDAKRLLNENPNLKYYEAIEKAKEVYEKEPIAGKQNRSLEKHLLMSVYHERRER